MLTQDEHKSNARNALGDLESRMPVTAEVKNGDSGLMSKCETIVLGRRRIHHSVELQVSSCRFNVSAHGGLGIVNC